MILYISHSFFDYEAGNLCRLFFPYEKLKTVKIASPYTIEKQQQKKVPRFLIIGGIILLIIIIVYIIVLLVTKDDDKINYVRVEDSKGAVVNLAQISGTTIDTVLKSEEYYTVKSYNVAIDKYITEVKHVTTNEITYQRDKLSYEKTEKCA